MIHSRGKKNTASVPFAKSLPFIFAYFLLCMLPVCLILLCITFRFYYSGQRWSPRGRPWPRGQILKSLALASKVKSLALASRLQVLENWPVLGSRTAVFFELLKFCEALEKFFGKRFFVETARKIFVKTFFFFFFLRSPKKFL